MVLSLILLLVGFVALIIGADKMVEGASALAMKYGIPPIVIGLTIVAFGTSAPELVVNVFASINDSSEMVLGNVLGSNIFNVLGILGICGIIYPLSVKSNTTWIEIPLSFMAAVAVLVITQDLWLDGSVVNYISRGDGIILLLFFSIFMVYNITVSLSPQEADESETLVLPLGKSLLWIALGLGGLVLGGKLIVDNAVSIAEGFGLSQRIIGLTIVSIGTSLPELATSVAAVRKRKLDIAIGNVVGSNIFNIFFVLGVSAVVSPFEINESSLVDILLNVLAGLLLFVFVFTGKGRRLDRWEGIVFLLLYAAYMVYLLV